MNTIAIDVDDTLNNFSETLRNTEFQYDDSYQLAPDVFHRYLEIIKSEKPDTEELLCTDYSFLKVKIQIQCHQLAKAKPEAPAFMQWLKDNNWRIVICTFRDLRRTDYTQRWLRENRIPYDYIFSVHNKIIFCKMWKITHLIDDDPMNIRNSAPYGIQVYYPIMEKNRNLPDSGAKGFQTFDEVKQWI